MTNQIIPCGFQVLIEIEAIEQTTESGIIIHRKHEFEREQDGQDVGRVVAFGPQCFKGFADCDSPQDWCSKLTIGSLVEFRRYDGKIPRHDKEKKYRCINDSDILMVIGEKNET